jgi:hypothetical protein
VAELSTAGTQFSAQRRLSSIMPDTNARAGLRPNGGKRQFSGNPPSCRVEHNAHKVVFDRCAGCEHKRDFIAVAS